MFLKSCPVQLKNKMSSLLIKKIPDIVGKLLALRSLEICCPSWISEYHGDDAGHAPQLDLEIWKAMNANIGTALTTNKLEHLTELRLTLICTYDFISLYESLSETMCSQLRSLQLRYNIFS